MFDHVTIRVSDGAASEAFYDLVLRTLGIEADQPWRTTSPSGTTSRSPAGARQARHAQASRWVRCAIARGGGRVLARRHCAGYRSDGEPGLRPQYRDDYYGSFLLDPDGNSAEAVHHGAMREGGVIDHLWFRVADLAAARSSTRRSGAMPATASIATVPSGRGSPAHPDRSRSRPASEPIPSTWPSPTDDNAAVEAFHADLVGLGYRDNGAPASGGSTTRGTTARSSSTPTGHNIEVVNHNR